MVTLVVTPGGGSVATAAGGGFAPPAIGKFDVISGGVTEYRNLIDAIRRQSSSDTRLNRPVTPQPKPDSTDARGYFSVELQASTNCVVELVIRRSDLYLMGWYRTKGNTYFSFKPDNGLKLYGFARDSKTTQKSLGKSYSYQDLGYPAEKRAQLDLGGGMLKNALESLCEDPAALEAYYKHAVVIIEMALEAARLQPLYEHLVHHYDEYAPPGAGLVELQNNWGALSGRAWQELNSSNNSGLPPLRVSDGYVYTALTDILAALMVVHHLNCDRNAWRTTTAVSAADDCSVAGGRFLVTVTQVSFENPGDAGPDLEPYGVIEVHSDKHWPMVVWEQGNQDIPHVNNVFPDARLVVDSASGPICFEATVRESDQTNGDDNLTSTVNFACGTGGTITFSGPDGNVYLYYSVQRLVRACLSWIAVPTCDVAGRDYLYHVTTISFVNPGEGGDPEPYGIVGVDPGRAGPFRAIWDQPHSSHVPTVPVGFVVPEVPAPTRVNVDARPCFYLDVQEHDNNPDDRLAPVGTFCGDERHLVATQDDNQVQLVYDFYEVLSGP
ncbi:ribosome-inactivating family protein [Micromonospora nigra]|nr:ribosome-inactivating family protein [Micromonospora nigra]